MIYLLYTKPWFKEHINFANVSIFDDNERVVDHLHRQSEDNVSSGSVGYCEFENMK